MEVVQQDRRVVAALNAEWRELTSRHHLDVREWAGRHPSLDGCGDLEQVLAAISAQADAVMGALLSETARGDYLAARVLLQAMLGKVVLLARRDPHASEQDYLVAMWCRIAGYPLSDRPVRIAANLAMDTLKTVRGERVWTPPGPAVSLLPPDQLLDRAATLMPDAGSPTATGVISTAEQLGLVDVVTRDVLLSVYAEGLSGVAAADRHQTTPDMVRYRCSRAVRRLAAHSTALAAA